MFIVCAFEILWECYVWGLRLVLHAYKKHRIHLMLLYVSNMPISYFLNRLRPQLLGCSSQHIYSGRKQQVCIPIMNQKKSLLNKDVYSKVPKGRCKIHSQTSLKNRLSPPFIHNVVI